MNMTKYSSLLSIVLLLFFTIPVAVRGADEKPAQNQRLTRLYSELKTLFRHYYPKATSHLQNDEIHFDHNTQFFSAPSRTKGGKLVGTHQERRPNRGGILCDLSLRRGEWGGQLGVPQTMDRHSFKILLMAPYSPKHDVHLWVHLSYPGNVNQNFLERFTKLMDDFPKYLD